MNQHSSESIVPMQEEMFPTVKKYGYSKPHVEDFVRSNNLKVRDLTEKLARERDALEMTRRELSQAKEMAAVKPEHEQVSERMAEILRIAEEEAKEKRSRINQEIERIHGEAKEESQKLVKDAQAHADRVLNSAREQAQELVESARQEAEQLRSQAQQDAERHLVEAERRSNKIESLADGRLATLTATHNEALRRLTDMRETLAELLEAEKRSGNLEEELAKPETEELPELTAEREPQDRVAQGEAEQAQPQEQGESGGEQPPDEATVRISPQMAEQAAGPQQRQVRQAPHHPQQPGPQHGPEGAGATGVHQRPEHGEAPNAEDGGTEGVRIIRP